MWVKALGALAVVLAGGAMGMYYSGLEQFRIRDLQEFKKAMLILTSEIEYLRTPLAEACINISQRTDKPVGSFFEGFAEALSEDGSAAYPAWMKTIEGKRGKTHLADEDFTVLDGFGKTLGYLDTQMQLNAINYVVAYIDTKTTELQARCDKNKRMYRSLGWIGGALVAVVLW